MEKINRKIPQKVLTQIVTWCIVDIVPQNVTERGDMLDAVKIGKKLSDLRGNKSQEEVAKAVGISTSALSMYECGERIPRDIIKVRLAKYYKKSVQYIFFTD